MNDERTYTVPEALNELCRMQGMRPIWTDDDVAKADKRKLNDLLDRWHDYKRYGTPVQRERRALLAKLATTTTNEEA